MTNVDENSKAVTLGGEEVIAPAAKLLTEAFTENPVLNYILPHSSIPSLLPKYFNTLLTAASLNGGIIAQVGNWKACGILMPPGCHVDRPSTLWKSGFLGMMWGVGFRGCWRMMREFQPSVDSSTIIPSNQNHKGLYYLYQIGTLPSARGQGFCTLILRYFQDLVLNEGTNNMIWLEATSEAAMQVYKREGWAVIDEAVIGKGKANKAGKLEIGGEGFTVWIMVWWPAKDHWVDMGEEGGFKMGEETWMKDLARRIEGNQHYGGSKRDRVMCEDRMKG